MFFKRKSPLLLDLEGFVKEAQIVDPRNLGDPKILRLEFVDMRFPVQSRPRYKVDLQLVVENILGEEPFTKDLVNQRISYKKVREGDNSTKIIVSFMSGRLCGLSYSYADYK